MPNKMLDGEVVEMTAEDIAQAEADAAAHAALPPPRRTIRKLTLQARVKDIGKINAVWAKLQSMPDAFGRWVMDGPDVFADDPELLGLLTVSGLTADEIAAVTAPD